MYEAMASDSSSALVTHPLYMRKNASPGLWLAAILPLSCSPGLYNANSSCTPSPKFYSILALQVGISSLHIINRITVKKGFSSLNILSRVKNPLGKAILHRYVPPLLASIALFLLGVTNLFVAICCSFLCYFLYMGLSEWIIFNFASSFSFGESLLVSQAATLTIVISAKSVFTLPKLFLEHEQISIFIQSAVLISSAWVALIWYFHRKISLAAVIFLLLVFGCFGIGVSSLLLREWCLTWLFATLTASPTRLALLGWCANITIVILVATNSVQRYMTVPQTVIRKMYHLLMVLVLVPGIILDPLFTYFACTAATILFILLEIVRAIDVEPLSSFLSGIFSFFVDEKDSGVLVLSHIYLLTGLASPLWLYPCNFLHSDYHASINYNHSTIEDVPESLTHPPVIALMAGILSVGIGDTMASVGGSYLGFHRWPGTKKTFEGSFFSIVSQVLFVAFLHSVRCLTVSWAIWPKLVVSTVICSVVEAFTDQVDNIVLPLILYFPLMVP